MYLYVKRDKIFYKLHEYYVNGRIFLHRKIWSLTFNERRLCAFAHKKCGKLLCHVEWMSKYSLEDA